MVANKTRTIVLTGVLAALAWVLMALEFPIFVYFPSYLKIDFSDVPAILGAIAIGPLAGVAIELVKNLLHFLTMSKEGGIGEIANFFAGVGLLVPVSIIIRAALKRSRNGFSEKKDSNTSKAQGKNDKITTTLVYSNIAGIFSMTLVANIINYFITLPLYMKNPPKEVIITTIFTLLVPFNIVKGIIVAIVVIVLFTSLRKVIMKYMQ